jgi:hypothetical protein
MKTSSKIGLACAAALLLLGCLTLFFLAQPSKATAEELIRKSLQEAEAGAKRRSANAVMSAISEDFEAGPWNKKRLYVYLIQQMRNGRGVHYDVRINQPRILPSPRGNPNERVVISKMSAFYSDSGDDIWGSGPLTMVMRKESRPRLLVFSEPHWRIVGVASLPPLPSDMDLAGY